MQCVQHGCVQYVQRMQHVQYVQYGILCGALCVMLGLLRPGCTLCDVLRSGRVVCDLLRAGHAVRDVLCRAQLRGYSAVAGWSVYGTPKVYVAGQPVRNVVRAVTW